MLDPTPPATVKADLTNAAGFGSGSTKAMTSGKPPIQIRETTNGGITLAGVTETDVTSQAEMALCLEQGSLCRATGSTMMNTRSRCRSCSFISLCANLIPYMPGLVMTWYDNCLIVVIIILFFLSVDRMRFLQLRWSSAGSGRCLWMEVV